MLDPTLILLANEVRGKTLRLLADVADDQARFTGTPALNNSILWHAGHSLWVVEQLAVAPATDRPAVYPPGWFEAFAAKSTPATVAAWPTLAEVTAALTDQLARLTAALGMLRQERLDQVIDVARNRTLRYSILHGLHDEAGHQGEIYLLKKMWARRGV